MRTNQLAFLLIIFWVAVTTADHRHDVNEFNEINLKGSCCPTIKYISNLNMARIVGWWYRAFSTANNPSLCYNNEGQTMYAAPLNERTLGIDICCRSAAINDIAFCGSIIGSGTVTATNNSGEFIYAFDDKSYTIYVLDTDYDNFAIVYGCNAGRRMCDELIYILSRDYKLSGSAEARVRRVLQENGIEFSKARPVKQGPSTPYTPNSRGTCL